MPEEKETTAEMLYERGETAKSTTAELLSPFTEESSPEQIKIPDSFAAAEGGSGSEEAPVIPLYVQTDQEADMVSEIEKILTAEGDPSPTETEAAPQIFESDTVITDVTVSPAPRRSRMIIALVAVLLATVSVIIYGVLVKDVLGRTVRNIDSLPAMMLGEVFGRGITEYGGGRGTVVLRRIPLPMVTDSENPGAAELERVPDIDTAEPGSGGEGEALRIKEVDLSVGENGIFTLINETGYTPDVLSLLTAPFPIPSTDSLEAEYGADAPLVLVLHTHGSESFSPEGATETDAGESFRSDDPEKSVVSVGRAFTEELRASGIGVIHIETMFDIEDYNSAYVKSAATVKEYLARYPSIRYVFDIHRDALITADGENLKPTAAGGEAQVMVVVGTDHGGANHPNWEDNLTVALRLQEAAGTVTPTLVRGINLRSPSFNEQYAPGFLLLEIGAAGNSVGEAEAAARLMGKAAAGVIKDGGVA